jgi:hypothetical protein
MAAEIIDLHTALSTAPTGGAIKLIDLERVVQRGREAVEALRDAGHALMRIREGDLYRATHATWGDYCRERWGWSSRHARRLIVFAELSSGPTGPLPSERHARELARLADPEDQAEALAEATVDAGGKPPTLSQLKAAVDRRAPAKSSAPKSLQDRRTPRRLFDLLCETFGLLQLDAYATADNALCSRFYTEDDDGNKQPWVPGTFWNPEFEDMATPVAKAVAEGRKGNWSVGIAPVGCSQTWYHELAIQGTIYCPDQRFSFDDQAGNTTGRPGDEEGGANRDHIVIAFGEGHWNRRWKRGEFRVRRLDLRAAAIREDA